MLTEFETRLAEVLGTRIPEPFTGRTVRRGATAPPGSGPVIRVGVNSLELREPEMGSIRPEKVPGSDDHRRVLRLGVRLGIEVTPENEGDRLQQLRGTEMLAYELDHPDVRSASVLAAPGDQGFLIESLRLVDGQLGRDVGGRSEVTVRAEGWFWPVGQAGETGIEIGRVLVREFRMPLRLEIGAPVAAGGSPVELRLRFGPTGTMVVEHNAVSRAPFGTVAVRVLNPGGGPGAGTLGGGTDGPDGRRLVTVDESGLIVTYTPPAGPAVDTLVVAAHGTDADGNHHVGVDLARFELVVGP